MQRLTTAHVKATVESLGYRFIGPYTCYSAPLPVICRCGCGDTLTLPYGKLLQGRGCRRCNKDNRSKARRLSTDKVRQILSDRGFEYVEGEYVNQRSRLVLRCRCGQLFTTTLFDAKHRIGCNQCAARHQSETQRGTLEEVRALFAQYGCELLATEYLNNEQRLAFRCSCGQVSSKSKVQMQKSKGGCRWCAPRRISEAHIRRLAPIKQTSEQRRAKARAYAKHCHDTDIQYRLRNSLRARVRDAVRDVGVKKATHTMTLVGCSMARLRAYLETRFQPGMTWENYGKGEGKWVIDHIRPCASFDLTDTEQQRQCFHYTNLQPLWWAENCEKSTRMPDGTFAKRKTPGG